MVGSHRQVHRTSSLSDPFLTTRNQTHARVEAGGTYFRSKFAGPLANQLRVRLLDGLLDGLLVVENLTFSAPEQVIVSNATVTVGQIRLEWNQRLELDAGQWLLTTTAYPGGLETSVPYAPALPSGVLTGVVTGQYRLQAGAAVTIRPRVRTFTAVIDPLSLTNGYDIDALRSLVNSDGTCWVRMPNRPGGLFSNEDQQDDGQDALDGATAFSPVQLQGGNGLPEFPVGIETGPKEKLIHISGAEHPINGSFMDLNVVYIWNFEDRRWDVYRPEMPFLTASAV